MSSSLPLSYRHCRASKVHRSILQSIVHVEEHLVQVQNLFEQLRLGPLDVLGVLILNQQLSYHCQLDRIAQAVEQL